MKKLAIALSALLACASVVVPARASDDSSFNPREVERAITEFYSVSRDPSLSGADREELADALADEIAILRPVYYNSVVGVLIQEYRHESDHRPEIELLVDHLQQKVQPELDRISARHPVVTVLDDVFRVWSAVYVVGVGRGLWESRASGLRGIQRFREVVSHVTERLPSRKRAALLAVGIGTPIGIAHAVYQQLETQRLDPKRLLRSCQEDILAAIRAQLATHQAELRTDEKELERDQEDLIYLAQHAPWLRPKVRNAMDELNDLRAHAQQRLREARRP